MAFAGFTIAPRHYHWVNDEDYLLCATICHQWYAAHFSFLNFIFVLAICMVAAPEFRQEPSWQRQVRSLSLGFKCRQRQALMIALYIAMEGSVPPQCKPAMAPLL